MYTHTSSMDETTQVSLKFRKVYETRSNAYYVINLTIFLIIENINYEII